MVMVTGDRVDVAETVGAAIGVDVVLAERLPEDKLDAVRSARAFGPTVMVGDGINDAPALAVADVGVAMCARGATAASEAADVVLTVNRLDRLAEAIGIARRARGIARQSALAGMALSLAAMGVAAAGALPPTAGALLQEGIDVAVILNALRAVTPGRSREPRLAGPPADLTRRLQAEHVGLRDTVEELRLLGDRLGRAADVPAVLAAVRAAYDRLVTDLLPHELAEETELYPALARVLGGDDPTGVMSRGHAEIEHLVRRIGRLLVDLGPDAPDEEDRTELQAVLYGLHAVLRLHFAQEEEGFFTLLDEETPAPTR
jgi:iron-sulfur cluster repair protein YtfE (RIC family)